MAAPVAAQESGSIATALKAAAVTASAEVPAAAAAGEPQAPAPPAPAENPVLTFFKNTELTGFVDTYYSYNFNTPAKPCATIGGVAIFNCLHNFDVAHNAFSLNMAEIALEKKPTPESRGGFRVDLDYGSAAAIVAGFDPSPTSINQNIQQAYLSYLAPAGKGTIQVDFGKFVTQHGAEVIETKDNWNYSRSLLFSLAIPYYHSGVRVAYSPNDKVTLGANLSNGWNNIVENNTGKTAGFMALVKPTAALSWTVNYMVGPEQTDDNADYRHLFDTTVSYTASPKVSLMLNYDFGKDTINKAGVKWQGVAAYVKYAPNSWFAFVPRYEYLTDKDGFMTGASQKIQEFTLTAEFKHKDGVLMRVEYRGDVSDTPFFNKNVSDIVKNQNALTVGWIYAFSSKTP
jgi:hypothetical protein